MSNAMANANQTFNNLAISSETQQPAKLNSDKSSKRMISHTVTVPSQASRERIRSDEIEGEDTDTGVQIQIEQNPGSPTNLS